MAKDCQGTLRGACTLCGCTMFVSDKGVRCDYCDHSAAKHQNVSAPPSKPKTTMASPQPNDKDQAVVTDDSNEDGLPDMFDLSLQDTPPSTLFFFGTSNLAPTLPYGPRQLMALQQQQPQLPQMCSLPGCTRPKYIEPATGKTHDCCGKAHALCLQRAMQATTVPPHLKCTTPGCNLHKCPLPGGSGFYDYCSIQCRNTGGGYGFLDIIPPERRCTLTGCTRERFVDPSSGRVMDYCGLTHAVLARSAGGQTSTVTSVSNISAATSVLNTSAATSVSNTTAVASVSNTSAAASVSNTSAATSVSKTSASTSGIFHSLTSIFSASKKSTATSALLFSATNTSAVTSGESFAFGLKQLSSNSADFISISAKFQNDWATPKHPCPSVDHIFEVSNKNLEKKWKDFSAALQTSSHPSSLEQHYHGTTIKCDLINSKSFCSNNDCGVCGISQQGFMKKYIGKNIPRFQRFGQGFYLAPHSSKSHDYTQGTHTHRAMLLCDVLPGKKHVIQTDQTHLVAPPQGYDSVYGQPGSSLNYPEIVIYDETSILPRHVIVYQKDGISKIAN